MGERNISLAPLGATLRYNVPLQVYTQSPFRCSVSTRPQCYNSYSKHYYSNNATEHKFQCSEKLQLFQLGRVFPRPQTSFLTFCLDQNIRFQSIWTPRTSRKMHLSELCKFIPAQRFDYKVVDEVGSLLKVTLPTFLIFFTVLSSFLVTSGNCFTRIFHGCIRSESLPIV